MDNLSTLMEAKQYESVIRLTEETFDPKSLFFRIAAFVGLNKPDSALEVLINNREILLKSDFIRTLKFNIEILLAVNKFDEARDALSFYENLPYQSQVVEESFKYYKKYIKDEEIAFYRVSGLVDDEQLGDELSNKDDDIVLGALQSLRKKDISSFFPLLKKILISEKRKISLRSFCLMLLVDKKVNSLVNYLTFDGTVIEVNPSTLSAPFSDETFKNVVKYIENNEKDPVLIENAKFILSTYCMTIYPNLVNEGRKSIIVTIIYLAKSYLNIKTSIEEECSKLGASITDVNAFIEKVETALKKFQD